MNFTDKEIAELNERSMNKAEQHQFEILWELLNPEVPTQNLSKYIDEDTINALGQAISKVYIKKSIGSPVQLLANVRCALIFYTQQLIKTSTAVSEREFKEEMR
jgi:hypothetical protein